MEDSEKKITTKISDIDKKYMKMAIDIAKKGEGKVNPNPLVGAVVVKEGRIIGSGYHQFFGGPHAEVYALNQAEDYDDGIIRGSENATMYITLEPCSHYGKTPPCAEKIIKMGIRKCFIGSRDPNPEVSGRGVQLLKKSGIEVVENVLEKECDELNQIFFKYIRTKIPYLFLKCGITLDGKMALKNKISKWITNDKAREKVQYYRNKFMGIMVGINTVLIDNPTLTARISNGENPFRIIIDPNLRISKDLKIVSENTDNKTIIVTSEINEHTEKRRILENKFNIKFKYLQGRKFTIKDILNKISELNIDSVLLEGGEKLISQAFKEEMVDAGEIFIANKIFGDTEAKPFISGFTCNDMKEAIVLKNIKYNIYGDNIGLEFSLKSYDGK